MNTITKTDALTYLSTNPVYDYVVLSPSDFGQLIYQSDVLNPDKIGILRYKLFLTDLICKLNPASGYVSCIVTDRKHDGMIISRVNLFVNEFLSQGWEIHTRKIWAHSLKTNLYRLTFSEIITFRKRSHHRTSTPTEYFRPDVWLIETPKVDKDISHHGVVPVQVLSRLIDTYTKAGDIVLDPFCGSGTTLVEAKRLGRNYLGCEIDDKMFNLAESNVKGVL